MAKGVREEKTRVNVGLDPEVAQSLKEYCVKTTGGIKKLSTLVNDAVKIYLESKGVKFESGDNAPPTA
ncbi:MAG: hypothetical protein E4G89_02610 [Methanothrix sp.]|nr:MAG: hypothetical protein E4G89_02610 [Methanothrix sp.]